MLSHRQPLRRGDLLGVAHLAELGEHLAKSDRLLGTGLFKELLAALGITRRGRPHDPNTALIRGSILDPRRWCYWSYRPPRLGFPQTVIPPQRRTPRTQPRQARPPRPAKNRGTLSTSRSRLEPTARPQGRKGGEDLPSTRRSTSIGVAHGAVIYERSNMMWYDLA